MDEQIGLELTKLLKQTSWLLVFDVIGAASDNQLWCVYSNPHRYDKIDPIVVGTLIELEEFAKHYNES